MARPTIHRVIFLTVAAYILYGANLAMYNVTWGSGEWLGEFSLKWGMIYFLFTAFSIFLFVVITISLWRPDSLRSMLQKIAYGREKIGVLRWILFFLLLIFPVWFLQYTPWGLVFRNTNLRIFFWGIITASLAILLTKGATFCGWKELIAVLILTATGFTIAQAFLYVSDYPFSMGWSEGNRMWDYSVLFGRELYNYPLDKRMPVLLETSRQFVGGLPFLLPGITIEIERAWIGLSVLIPYILLGFAAFGFTRRIHIRNWMFATLWVLLFLKQGPIHPPLVLCAVFVALIWRRPLWLAIPVIAVTGYAAQASRYTWLFAPAIWIGMLEFAGAALEEKKISRQTWIRTIVLGLAGAMGGYFGAKVVGILKGNLNASAAISVSGVTDSVTSQALLWYRLFPNATYGNGILIGLLIAIIPLFVVLGYLLFSKKWILNTWQSLALVFPALAFLGVGLVASTKIGGGGDLHNMDMFLIACMFIGVIAWRNNGGKWLDEISEWPLFVRISLALMFIVPGIAPLTSLRTYEYSGDIVWLLTLTDSVVEKELELLPGPAIVEEAFRSIEDEVAFAQGKGEILFIDQRQLLTFNYMADIPFVPEYEKKMLMDKALRSDALYFEAYYRDLASKRFSLIISEPLRAPVKDSAYQFGEENNAWVKWVSNPTLCYYEPKVDMLEVGVQLLIPRQGIVDCSLQIP